MRIYLGPYHGFWGPYQLADLLQKFGVSEDKCHAIGEKLADTKLNDICQWIDSKRKRKIKIKIHSYDTWSMDGTLSYMIYPMLIQLKATKHGAPYVDDEDVPENLRSTNAEPKENEYDTDEHHFKRWDWVLDEMIWTFKQLHPDCDWEDQYHTGYIDIQWKPCIPKNTLLDREDKEELFEMVIGPKDTHVFDKEGYLKHSARIDNGTRLFGKYYRSLWD